MTADGEGLVSHAGVALLVELADRVGLTSALSEALAGTRERRSVHDPGRVMRDVAVVLADGGETGEALAAILQPGNAGAEHRRGSLHGARARAHAVPAEDLDREILVRTDIGGATHAFTSDCREAGIRFSVGYELNDTVRAAILESPEAAWVQAIDARRQRP